MRHVLTHKNGRLPSQLRMDKSGGSARYPIHMEVMHAFYDSDVLAGKILGGYGWRTADLLVSWLAPADSEGAGSTYTWLGKDDSAVALVFARDGPQYWRKDFIAGLSCLKMFGNNGYYTMEFADGGGCGGGRTESNSEICNTLLCLFSRSGGGIVYNI